VVLIGTSTPRQHPPCRQAQRDPAGALRTPAPPLGKLEIGSERRTDIQLVSMNPGLHELRPA
jgi:hypothetical protein